MGFLEKLKNLNENNVGSRKEFKNESIGFFKKLLNKLKEKNWEIQDELINKLERRLRKSSHSIKQWKIKYKNEEFDEYKYPGLRAKKNPIDYFLLSNNKIEELLNVIVGRQSKKHAFGFGIVIKDKKKIKVGLQAAIGDTRGSQGGKFNEFSKNNSYVEEIDLSYVQNDNKLINKIVKSFTDKLDKINKEGGFEEIKRKLQLSNHTNSETNINYSDVKAGKLRAILTALQTKPFLIFAGVSGTGKTQIARIIAGVMSKESAGKSNEGGKKGQ